MTLDARKDRTALRLRLYENGFAPLANKSKMCLIKGWSTLEVTPEAEETEAVVIGHTHDEILCEVDTTRASGFAERLESAMVAGFDWTEGLPLAAEVEVDYYYHK